jgi:hypothetical protein
MASTGMRGDNTHGWGGGALRDIAEGCASYAQFDQLLVLLLHFLQQIILVQHVV